MWTKCAASVHQATMFQMETKQQQQLGSVGQALTDLKIKLHYIKDKAPFMSFLPILNILTLFKNNGASTTMGNP